MIICIIQDINTKKTFYEKINFIYGNTLFKERICGKFQHIIHLCNKNIEKLEAKIMNMDFNRSHLYLDVFENITELQGEKVSNKIKQNMDNKNKARINDLAIQIDYRDKLIIQYKGFKNLHNILEEEELLLL